MLTIKRISVQSLWAINYAVRNKYEPAITTFEAFKMASGWFLMKPLQLCQKEKSNVEKF